MPVSISGAGSISGLDQGFNVTTGSVGVGTTNPRTDLQVGAFSGGDSNIQLATGTSGASNILFGDGSGGSDYYKGFIKYNHSTDNLELYTTDDLIHYTGGSERLRINAAGNVGIASATPAARLDVYKNFGGIGAGIYAGRVYGTDSGVSETGVRFVTKGTGDLHNASDAYLMHGISNGTTRFVFGANGNFGLGTDNPDATLKVNVASGNNGVVVQNTSTANIALFGARNGDATVQIGQWGSTASGSTFGLSNADLSFIYTTSYSTTHPSALALGTVSNKPIVFATNNTERLRIDSSGHLLHGVTADEDTSGNGGFRFINSGDIQIDGDQKALVFRSTNNTAQLQSAIEWWNENGAGVQAKISCDRTAVSQAPSDLVFYTSSNVDLGGAGSDGAITERLRIRSDGRIAIGTQTINTDSMLSIHRSSSDQSQIRFTNTTTGEGGNNGLIVGIDNNEHGRIFNMENNPLRFGTNNTERVRISSDGKFGIGIQSPFSRFQSGGHTFSGGHGMHSDGRVGMSNHGQLTGLMLASTYNDGAHPEYGLVFVQGPNTSSYNVWGLCPDGPAKGNSLNFHYAPQGTNIHSPGYRKFQMTGDGYFLKPNHPSFRAGRNGNYSPGAGSDIIFNTVSGGAKHNVGGHYNTSNGRFTAPVAGVYTFTAHVIWQGLGSGQNMADCFHPQINGTNVGYSGRRGEYIANETGNGGYYTDFMTYQFTLAAGDYVTINNQFNLTVHGNSNYTTFSGHLVG